VTTLGALCPTDRFDRAWFLISEAVKVRVIFGLLHRMVVQQGGRVIIFSDWPVLIYHLTLAGEMYGFGVGNLRAGMTNLQRQNTIREFCDPKSKQFSVLVASSRTSAAGLNLQEACSNVIIMDLIPSSAVQQASGRIHRFGQENEQECVVIVADRTYDQVLLSKYMDRAVAQIATTMKKQTVPDDEYKKIRDEMPQQVEHIAGKLGVEEDEAIRTIHHVMQAQWLYMLANGIRSPRDNPWHRDESDPDKKLGLKHEYEYLSGVPCYAPIIEAYNARPVAGSAAHVKTPKKKKGKKSVEDILKGSYPSKINFKSSSKKGAAA
jgi:superfamily II DNA/RNA helicase